jgi:hypothetical protein
VIAFQRARESEARALQTIATSGEAGGVSSDARQLPLFGN